MPTKDFQIFGEKVTITSLKTGKLWTFLGPPNGIGLMQFKKADIALMALLLIMKSTFIRPYFHFMPIRYGVSFHLCAAAKRKSDQGYGISRFHCT